MSSSKYSRSNSGFKPPFGGNNPQNGSNGSHSSNSGGSSNDDWRGFGYNMSNIPDTNHMYGQDSGYSWYGPNGNKFTSPQSVDMEGVANTENDIMTRLKKKFPLVDCSYIQSLLKGLGYNEKLTTDVIKYSMKNNAPDEPDTTNTKSISLTTEKSQKLEKFRKITKLEQEHSIAILSAANWELAKILVDISLSLNITLNRCEDKMKHEVVDYITKKYGLEVYPTSCALQQYNWDISHFMDTLTRHDTPGQVKNNEDTENQRKVKHIVSITRLSPEKAIQLLKNNNMSVQNALNSFYTDGNITKKESMMVDDTCDKEFQSSESVDIHNENQLPVSKPKLKSSTSSVEMIENIVTNIKNKVNKNNKKENNNVEPPTNIIFEQIVNHGTLNKNEMMFTPPTVDLGISKQTPVEIERYVKATSYIHTNWLQGINKINQEQLKTKHRLKWTGRREFGKPNPTKKREKPKQIKQDLIVIDDDDL